MIKLYLVAVFLIGCQSTADERLPICENSLEFAKSRIAELEIQISMMSEGCIDYD